MSEGMKEVAMEGAGKTKLDGTVGHAVNENGVHHWSVITDETNEDLMRMVIELGFQNDYLKAQIGSLGWRAVGSIDPDTQGAASVEDGGDSGQVDQLHEKIKCLNKELQEQKETQKAAEDALEHLRVAYASSDAKVQEFSEKLAQAQQKMEHEIKERDDKYVELDSKFSRLHKRAKQRIQELQKEKDDLETRVQEMNVLAEQASNQQILRQQDLERTRQQANEALRLMDSERQQLRAANNKLRENVDEMRCSLEAKESALVGIQQTLFEKEKMLEDTRNLLRALEEKKQSSFLELSAKHQKQLESLETQLAEALVDRKKASETISSLQLLIDEKDKKIADLDAASSGEVVRLGATLEEMKAELVQLQDKHAHKGPHSRPRSKLTRSPLTPHHARTNLRSKLNSSCSPHLRGRALDPETSRKNFPTHGTQGSGKAKTSNSRYCQCCFFSIYYPINLPMIPILGFV